jgi:alpha-N-arabinofuranosidase
MSAINTFDKPETVKPQAFSGAKLAAGALTVDLPARSVVMLGLQ